jgi:hypothetical protein
MRWNLEANQEVADKGFAEDAAEIFMQDIEESEEIFYVSWIKRPRQRRWLESFYGWVMLWVEYFAHLKRVRLTRSFRSSLKATLPHWIGKRL